MGPVLGKCRNQLRRWVSGLPEAAGEAATAARISAEPDDPALATPLDLGDGLYWRITSAFELDDLFGLHVVLEVGQEARQQVTEQRVGDRPLTNVSATRAAASGRVHSSSVQTMLDQRRPRSARLRWDASLPSSKMGVRVNDPAAHRKQAKTP